MVDLLLMCALIEGSCALRNNTSTITCVCAVQLGYRPAKDTAVLVNGSISSASNGNGNGSGAKQLNAAARAEE